MGFDYQNFGIGLAAGWASAYGVYRARGILSSARLSATERRATAQNYATRSSDRRYIEDIVPIWERTHLAGRFVNLSDVLTEPRFMPARELPQPYDEDAMMQSVFHVLPDVPEFPYLQAPYNFESLSIDDLGEGSRALALLGLPGSGRTTALITIALKALGQVKFPEPRDHIQERLDEEEAELDEKERAVRVKERIELEQRAKDQLAEDANVAFDVAEEGAVKVEVPTFNRLMPIYIHLADINFRDGEFGKEVDPSEPLVRNLQRLTRQSSRVTARTIPSGIYKRVNNGQVLLLVDGYDDLPDAVRQEKLHWLTAFMQHFPDNFYIVAGPATGYGELTELGLTPVFMRPWTDLNIQEVADRWAAAWPRINADKKGRPAPPPDPSALERALINTRGLAPFDLTHKIWSSYADDLDDVGLSGWIRAYLSRHLPEKQALDDILEQLTVAASIQVEQGYITSRLLAHDTLDPAPVEAEAPTDSATELAEAGSELSDEDLLLAGADGQVEAEDSAESEAEESKSKKEAKKESKEEKKRQQELEKQEREASSEHDKLLHLLHQHGILTMYPGNRYRFQHPFVATYLASLTLQENTTEELAAKSSDPRWFYPIYHAAAHMPIDAAVAARYEMAADVANNHILEVVRWLTHADTDVSWRTNLLRQLGNMFVAPNQYPIIRERAAAALVGARDRSAAVIFGKALRHANPDVRRLACLGLGAIGYPDSVREVAVALQDPERDVKLAASFALGAIGGDDALDAMVLAFTEGEEQLRQSVAETFAGLPDEGHSMLYDAINDDEMMLRRAAVFGLRRIDATWAVIAIYRTFLEDPEWYVRSAAQQAFQDIQIKPDRSPKALPPLEAVEWFVDWVSALGEGVPAGESAHQLLVKALQEGDTEIRALSALTLGQLGILSTLKPLYNALRDREEYVRSAAHQALTGLQQELGRPFPAAV